MFQKFLHPELILFGCLLDPVLTIPHDTSTKDGEMVVHQKINRFSLDLAHYPTRQEQEIIERQIVKEKGEEFLEQDLEDSRRPAFKKGETEQVIGESFARQGNIQGFYENQQNPYDDEYYGFNMDAQYAPQQFASNDSKTALEESPAKPAQNQHIPFTEQSPEKVEEEDSSYKEGPQEIDTENAFLTGVAEVQFGDQANELMGDFALM